MDIKTSVIALKEQLFSSVKLYPLASAAALIFTVACWALVDDHRNLMMQKIAFASSFGFVLLSALYHWRRDIVTLGSGVVLIVLYYLSIPSSFSSDSTFVNKYIVLIVTSFILLAVLPFLQKWESNLKSWAWELNIFMALINSAVFGLILYGGLAGAIKASSILFEFAVNEKYYIYLLIAIMGLFGSHYFLSSLRLKDIDMQKAFYDRFGSFFVRYILTSIATVYALILSGYVLKILLTQEWPNGILVWLSLVFASLSLATYLFWTPLGGKYRKLLIGVALVQLGLLFIAISMRVSQYGWSEDRYLVVMLGIWFGVTFVYLILSKAPKYEYPLVLLALFLLLSQYGWRLSAYDVSSRSQVDRLIRLLSDNPNLSAKSPREIRCAVSSSISLLVRYQRADLLSQIMPDTVKKFDLQHGFETKNYFGYEFTRFATQELGFEYLNEWECRNNRFESEPPNRYFNSRWDEPISIAGYDSMQPDNGIYLAQKAEGEQPNTVIIKEKGLTIGKFDISPLVKGLIQNRENKNSISSDQFVFSSENHDIAIRIHFEYLNIGQDGNATDARGIVLIHKKDRE